MSVVNKKYNQYDLTHEYGIGYTSNTHREFYFDLEDYHLIKDYCWREKITKSTGYHSLQAWDSKTSKHIKMHWLFGYKGYDHINRNPLDNRRSNLRIANKKENAINHSLRKDSSSGISGVNYNRGKWESRIKVNDKRLYLGAYVNIEDAIISKLCAELKYFGLDFAPQRHLFEQYGIIQQND